MISHKCYINPHVLMMRSKVSKDLSRGFQASSENSFLISARKSLPTFSQTFNVIFRKTYEFNIKPREAYIFDVKYQNLSLTITTGRRA